MTANDIETRLRRTLGELAREAPLVNPLHPKRESDVPSRSRHRLGRGDAKTFWLVSCLLVVMGILIVEGIRTEAHAPSPPVPAVSVPAPSSTTSLPPPGPFVVPDVHGLSVGRASAALQAVGLTNSIDNLNCGPAIATGRVVSQNPPAGFRAARDSRVNLKISCRRTDRARTSGTSG